MDGSRSRWPWVEALYDRVVDRRLRIRTGGFITTERLGISRPGNHDYTPTRVRHFHTFMREVDAEALQGTFVDYGSGKGRILALAAAYPFRRLVGIEISTTLNAVARANLDRLNLPRETSEFEIWSGDATTYCVPDDATVFYFYNPFHGAVLTGVFARLGASLRRRPRRLFVIFNNPVHFEKIAHHYPWLRPRARFRFEQPCIVYETAPDVGR